MNTELEKIKKVLSRGFYLRQIDADEAEKRGEELMSTQDMRYLREFKVKSRNFDLLTVKPEKGLMLSKKFLEEKINEAKAKKLMGLQISDREIYSDTMNVIKENNLFVSHNQMVAVGLVNYTYFFFDEENKIIHEIIKYQDFFGGLASVANLI